MGDSYRALRGGNYREGGADAVAGEVYDDVPKRLVEDLVARHAIEHVPTPPKESGSGGRAKSEN